MPLSGRSGETGSADGYDLLDLATGQSVVKIVRKVLGDTLGSSRQAITADDFKLAIKGLADDINAFVNNRHEANSTRAWRKTSS